MKITEYQIIEAIDLLYRAKESAVVNRLMNSCDEQMKSYNKGREIALEDCIKLLETLFKPQEIKKDEN